MTYRVRNIVLAFALATLAALLTTFYVSNYKRSVQQGEENVRVFVASKDIAAGTSGADAVKTGLLEPREVARRSVVPGAISSADQLGDRIAAEDVYAGEQVSLRRFRPVEERGVRAELKGNQRAVQVPGDANQLLAGTLKDGDRVDVLANLKASRGDLEVNATRVVLRDLLVLRASGGELASEKLGATTEGYAVQLAVTDTQAQKLFFVTKNGDWALQLRPVVDASDSPESVETLKTVLCDGMRRSYGICYGGAR